MKPSFALDFRDGVVALLHRTSRGWNQVGATPLDAPDLAEALNYLRATALGLSPRGLTTKLVLPSDQVLYTQVYAPGPEVAKRRRQVKAAIEGLTPYAIDDLVFDWWGTGPEVQVAIIAKETLAEAEAFATEHRFNPVSFVAVPENGTYLGEPFFGPSALSATLLTQGEKVERDQDPISVIARDFPRSESPAAVFTPEPVLAEPMPADPVPEEIHPEPASSVQTPVVFPEVGVESEPTLPEPILPEVTALELTPVKIAEPPAAKPSPIEVAVAAHKSAEAAEANQLPDFRAAILPPPGAAAFDPKTMAVDLVDEAPMAEDVSDDLPPPPSSTASSWADRGTAKPPIVATAPDDEVPASPAAEIIAAFASRRTAAMGATAPKSSTVSEPSKVPSVGPAPTTPRPQVARPALARPVSPPPVTARGTLPFAPKPGAAKPMIGGKPNKTNGTAVTAPSIAGARRERNVVPLLPVASGTADTAVTRPVVKPSSKTVTGLDGRPLPSTNKPRYLGLILTAILLILLALVGAWSTFLASDDGATTTAPATATAALAPTPSPEAVVAPATSSPTSDITTASTDTAAVDNANANTEDPSIGDLPTVEDEAIADGQDPTATGDVPPADSMATTNPDAGVPATSDQAALGPTAAEKAAADLVAADKAAAALAATAVAKPEPAPNTLISTEGAIAASPGTEPQDEIFLASADTPPKTSDPVTLLQVASNGDPAPDAAPPPPPFGTVYQFDAEGRIKPTPEGIITPEGVLLIAGKPKLVPPERPAALTAAAVPATLPTVTATLPAADATLPATADPTATASTAVVAAPQPFPSDPALAGKKPKARPADLAPATTAKQGEDLAPALDSRFATLRPQPRPAALTVAPQTTAADASLATNGVQATAANRLVLAVSRKPAARPNGLNQAVDAAVAAAMNAPVPQPEPTVQASNAPEAQSEPDTESPAPRLPTSASVAKQATDRHAINTGKLALLGVFGSASQRYAMIRQPNGGVKKIRVGDQIDGGRVAAITTNAVQYQKGGRMLTLQMPTG
ncbi:MAG: hypothetical protein ABIV25_15710 [Paracoccaceae bacterium]